MNMHIHIWTLVGVKDNGGLQSLLAPLSVFSPVQYKDTNFPLRPSQGWHGGTLKHP